MNNNTNSLCFELCPYKTFVVLVQNPIREYIHFYAVREINNAFSKWLARSLGLVIPDLGNLSR